MKLVRKYLPLAAILALAACSANGTLSNEIYGELKGGVESSRRF